MGGVEKWEQMLRLHGSGLVFVFPNRKTERKNAESLTWSCRVTEKRSITYTSLRTPLSAAESVVRDWKGRTAAHHRGNYIAYGKRERASYRTAVFAEDCRIKKEQGSVPALFCYFLNALEMIVVATSLMRSCFPYNSFIHVSPLSYSALNCCL